MLAYCGSPGSTGLVLHTALAVTDRPMRQAKYAISWGSLDLAADTDGLASLESSMARLLSELSFFADCADSCEEAVTLLASVDL